VNGKSTEHDLLLDADLPNLLADTIQKEKLNPVIKRWVIGHGQTYDLVEVQRILGFERKRYPLAVGHGGFRFGIPSYATMRATGLTIGPWGNKDWTLVLY